MAVEGLLRTLAGLVPAGNARHADFVGLDVSRRLAKWLLKHADDGRAGTIANDTGRGLVGLLTAAFTAVTLHMQESAAFYIAHPAGPLARLFSQVVTEVGWHLRQTLSGSKTASCSAMPTITTATNHSCSATCRVRDGLVAVARAGPAMMPRYCDVVVRRWEELTGKTAERRPVATG